MLYGAAIRASIRTRVGRLAVINGGKMQGRVEEFMLCCVYSKPKCIYMHGYWVMVFYEDVNGGACVSICRPTDGTV